MEVLTFIGVNDVGGFMFNEEIIHEDAKKSEDQEIKAFICSLSIFGAHMREHLITLGVVFFIVGILLTVVTFGIGIICAGPLILVGIILFLLGFVLPHEGRQVVIPPPPPEAPRNKRYCTNCGREIPFDANVCPYCGKDFRVK
jgi:hypothetical protein